MILKKHILLCALLLTGFSVMAQDCRLTIRGMVQDQDSRESLGFAVVKLLAPEKTVQANETGEFVFEGLCSGTYQILIQHFGCRDTVFSIHLNKSKKVVFKLPHSLNNLDEVDIMDKRVEMQKTQTVNQLSEEELAQTKGQSLGDILKNISGVTALNTGATISKPMLHGMQGYRLLILNNGIRQEGQQWGNEHAPEIDPFMAKKVAVVKGVNAIRYGSDAIAGVVLVEPNELPDTSAVTGEINLAGFSNGRTGAASGILEGSFDKVKGFSWRVQGSIKQGGAVKTPAYYLSNTGIKEHNFSYALGYHYKKWGAELYYSKFNTSIGIYRGAHIGNLTDLQAALTRNKPADSLAEFSYTFDRPRQEAMHELIKALTHYHLSSKWRVKLQYARQYNLRKEYDLRRLTSQERQTGIVYPDMNLRIASQTVDALLEHDNIKAFRGVFGASYMNQNNVYEGRFFIPNYLSNSFGLFASERYVMNYMEFELGVRYDEKYLRSFFYEGTEWKEHTRSFKNITYNGGLIWKPLPFFNFFLNGGSAWRAPAPNELYSNGIHQGIGTIERGNKNFDSETCYNITATGIYKFKKITLEMTAYYNRFRNFIYLNPTGQLELTIRGAFPVFEYRQSNVSINGLDFKAEYAVSNYFSLITKGMLVRGWNFSNNDYLIYMPSDRADLTLKMKIPSWRVFKHSAIQINNQFVSKQWRAPKNVDFMEPPPAYYLLGVNLGTEIHVKKQKFLLNLSATNLLNARYREYLDQFRYYADAVGVSYNIRLTIPLVVYTPKPVSR